MGDWDDLEIRAIVHDGARSTVYRATRPADNRSVILKVLTTSYDDAVNRARLQRELTIARRMDSQVVVKAYATTYHEHRFALVLEDFGGESLRQPAPEDCALATSLPIALGIARCLAVVHRAGVVHRDVKPSNVIRCARTGEIKITDFGAALVLGETGTETPPEGTLEYMAPEQTGRMGRPIDRRADLYALGVLLYELFTGEHPFQASDALEWMHCHAARIPRPPTEPS